MRKQMVKLLFVSSRNQDGVPGFPLYCFPSNVTCSQISLHQYCMFQSHVFLRCPCLILFGPAAQGTKPWSSVRCTKFACVSLHVTFYCAQVF